VRIEDAHDEDDGCDVDHGRGYEEGGRDPEREPRAGERDEQGDRGAGAERRDRPEERPHDVSPDAFEPPEDALAALGREVALDVADDEYHHAKQDDYLDRVVDEEVERVTPLRGDVETQRAHEHRHQVREPLHLEHLVHKERFDCFHSCSYTFINFNVFQIISTYLKVSIY